MNTETSSLYRQIGIAEQFKTGMGEFPQPLNESGTTGVALEMARRRAAQPKVEESAPEPAKVFLWG